VLWKQITAGLSLVVGAEEALGVGCAEAGFADFVRADCLAGPAALAETRVGAAAGDGIAGGEGH
jgi:hypothetical protein